MPLYYTLGGKSREKVYDSLKDYIERSGTAYWVRTNINRVRADCATITPKRYRKEVDNVSSHLT